ncbi:MAG: hypothetical protein QXP59_04020 [Saccharolobus sp.]
MTKKLKVLGIDVDGTLSDTMGKWLEFYKRDYDVEVSKEDMFLYNFSQIFPFVDMKIMRKYFEEVWDNWKDIDAIISEDDITELNKLHKKFRIEIITSSWGNLENVKNWLELHKINYNSLIYVKESLEKYKYCDILVDDKEKTVAEMLKHGKNGILLKQPWNFDTLNRHIPKEMKVCNSWSEVINVLKEI